MVLLLQEVGKTGLYNREVLTGIKLGLARLTDSADDFLYSKGLEFL